MSLDATVKLAYRPPAGESKDQGGSSDAFDFVIVKTLDKATFSDDADNGLLLPAVRDNGEAAITDGTSNTIMFAEMLPSHDGTTVATETVTIAYEGLLLI
jgi:hypothetical protein